MNQDISSLRDMLPEDVIGECDPFNISSHEATILDVGDIPLVSVSVEGKPDIIRTSVHQGQSTCEFVVLSHVRSPNLVLDSNSNGSLQQLQGLVNDLLQSKILLSLGTTLPFWIETICVPEDHRKRAATEKIKRVFEAAVAVLVLESSLLRQGPGSTSDYVTAIKRSPWTKRLWRLQEAALARRLCFRFHKATVVLDDLNIPQGAAERITAIERDHSTGNPNEVQKNLNCRDLLDEDIESLKDSHMAAKDMVKGDKPEGASEAYSSGLKNFHLKSISRLGYLSLPRFSLIRYIDENIKSKAVIEQILMLYKTEQTAGQGTKTSMSMEMRLGVLEALDIDRPLRESDMIELNYISAASHPIIQAMLQREDQKHCYHGLSVYYAKPLTFLQMSV